VSTTITSKGQVTIPKHIRDYLGLKAGSRVDFDVNKEGRIEVLPSEPRSEETPQQRLERALAALEVDNRWNGTTDEYMALIRGED
jgi:AbrB family looped-hinge helix DNA binding protein